MASPKYGDIAEFDQDGSPLRVMVIAARHFGDETTVEGVSWAVILSGTTPYDGAIRGPGYIGPIQNDKANWVER